MQEVQSTLPLGMIIRGQYVIERVLGRGSCGAVYVVRDVRGNQNLFALKEVINPGRKDGYGFSFDPAVLRRLEHPALPCIYAVFNTNKQDRAYILAEYIEGPNLEKVRLEQPTKRFSLPEALTLMTPIMEAVLYLHSLRPPIIHRDIKSSHIIISAKSGKAMLVDFGIASGYDSEAATNSVHYATSVYKAPEQYNGEADPRTDMYALGAIFYTLLTGTVPVDASYRLMQLDNKQLDPLIPIHRIIPALPMSVARCIQRAMSIDSNNRFPTVKQFWHALNAYAGTKQAATLQIPVEETPVQSPPEPLIATGQPSPLHTEPIVQQTPRPLIETEEVPSLSANPTVEQTPEPPMEVEEIPTFAADSVNLIVEPSIEVEEAPPLADDTIVQTPTEPVIVAGPTLTLNEDSMEQGATEPAIASSASPPVTPEEVKIPAALPVEESAPVQHPQKSGRLLLTLFAVLVILLGSIGGADLWFYTAGQHHPVPTLPSPASQGGHASPRPAASPTPRVPSTSTPVSSPYPTIAAQYTGTLHDIPTNITTNIALTRIQQQQGNISGYFSELPANTLFNGIPQNGPFTGTIETAKQIHFIVTSAIGPATFSFDGAMQPDGTIAGNYCTLGTTAGKCSDYGIWSLSPAH